MATKGKVEVEITGTDKASGVFNKVGGNLQKLGKVATGIGVVGAAGLFAITKAAADFEGKMREVNSMIGLSQKEFEALSKQVQGVAKDVGKSSEELSGALYQIVSAGVDSAHAIDVLNVAAKAAVAGVTDVETAADGLTTVLNAFKIPASEAQKVADVLFTTVKGGKTTFEELSASMFNVAPIAATAGVKFEEVAAAIATVTKQGVPTSVATTQLRAAIQAIIKPTADMQNAFKKLGYESGEAMLGALGFKGAITALRDTAGGSLETLGTMFGSVEGLSAILALTGENAQTFSADLEASMNAAGAATAAYDEINQGAGRQFEVLINKIKTIGEELGANLLPILIDLAEKIGAVVEKVSVWIQEHPKLTQAIVIFAAALTALTLIGGPLAMMSTQIASIISIGSKLAVFIVTALIPKLIALASTFIATLAAMGPWGWAAIAGGIAAAAAGIAGLMGLLGGGGGGSTAGPREVSPGVYRPPTAAEAAASGGGVPPPSMQHGGIVPGAIGEPVPIIAHGGERFLGVGAGAGGDTYQFNFPNYVGSRTELIQLIREGLLKIKSRNVTTGL